MIYYTKSYVTVISLSQYLTELYPPFFLWQYAMIKCLVMRWSEANDIGIVMQREATVDLTTS